jgi:Arrestin (or S-antigen), N-terminal domain
MSSAFIQTDKPFYFAGDTIQGHIFLNLAQPINANEIIVKFKGWESVRWIEERVLTET